MIDEEVEATAEVSENYQVAGQNTNLELALEIPESAHTAKLIDPSKR